MLKATPQFHPHRQLITQLGLAVGAAASTLRALLSLAVAAGASPDVAPWSRYSQMRIDAGRRNPMGEDSSDEDDDRSPTAGGGEEASRSDDSTPRVVGAGHAKTRLGRQLDLRLAAAAAGNGKRYISAQQCTGEKAAAAAATSAAVAPDSDRSDPPSSHRTAREHRAEIFARRMAMRAQAGDTDRSGGDVSNRPSGGQAGKRAVEAASRAAARAEMRAASMKMSGEEEELRADKGSPTTDRPPRARVKEEQPETDTGFQLRVPMWLRPPITPAGPREPSPNLPHDENARVALPAPRGQHTFPPPEKLPDPGPDGKFITNSQRGADIATRVQFQPPPRLDIADGEDEDNGGEDSSRSDGWSFFGVSPRSNLNAGSTSPSPPAGRRLGTGDSSAPMRRPSYEEQLAARGEADE